MRGENETTKLVDKTGIRVLIGADIVPTSKSMNYFIEADIDALIGKELKEELECADIRIFNLETPLADVETPIRKCGPNLIAPIAAINGIRSLNPTCLTLANNHIMDHGKKGLCSTIEMLNKVNIPFVGIGRNISEAQRPWIIEIKGMRLGVYACTEHEFSIADEDSCGANPFDPLESFDHVAGLKNTCDYVIVLYHGGKEYFRYPSPKLQKYCRKFVEKGADLVVCQHTHCIGCEEKYKEGVIVYGQGNFLFEKYENEYWDTSLIVCMDISKLRADIKYIPLKRTTPGVRIATSETEDMIMNSFTDRSREIAETGKVEEIYNSYVKKNGHIPLTRINPFLTSLPCRILSKLTGGVFRSWYIKRCWLKKDLYQVLNTLECEAWHEMLLTYLKNNRL